MKKPGTQERPAKPARDLLIQAIQEASIQHRPGAHSVPYGLLRRRSLRSPFEITSVPSRLLKSSWSEVDAFAKPDTTLPTAQHGTGTALAGARMLAAENWNIRNDQ